jgi:hypothetical protein
MGDWAYLVINKSGMVDESFEPNEALAAAKYMVPALWTTLYRASHFQDRTTDWDIYDALLVPAQEGIALASSRRTKFLELFGEPYAAYFDCWLEQLQPAVGDYLLLDIGDFNALSGEGFGREIHTCVSAWETGIPMDVESMLGIAGFDYDRQTGRAVVSPKKDEETLRICLQGTFLKRQA